MKPDTKTAMVNLIKEARGKIPFNLSFGGYCEGRCDECPEKLMEFLSMELSEWEKRLNEGYVPILCDVHTLAHGCKMTYDALQKRNLVN